MPLPEQRTFSNIRERFTDPSITIIYNDNAGISKKNPLKAASFRHKIRSLHHLLNSPEAFDLDINLQPTKSANHAIDEVGKAIDQGRGAIAVVGGDGTIAPIAHRLAVETADRKPDLLLLGGGTQNIFRREVSKRSDPIQVAIDVLQNGERKAIDVGVLQSNDKAYPFVANGGFGLDAQVMEFWERAGKKHRGQIFPLFWKERNNFQPFSLHIVDEQTNVDEVFDNVIAMPIINAGKYGGFFKLTESDKSDGILEGVVLPADLRKPQEFMHMLPKVLFSGNEINGANYVELRQATLRETQGEELLFQHDGEPVRADSSEVSVTTLHQSVTIWAA